MSFYNLRHEARRLQRKCCLVLLSEVQWQKKIGLAPDFLSKPVVKSYKLFKNLALAAALSKGVPGNESYSTYQCFSPESFAFAKSDL